MKENNAKKRSAFDVFWDVENATNKLEALPSILQLIIENFDLDRELTGDEKQKNAYDYSIRRDDLYNSIYLVQSIIFDTVSQLKAIKLSEEVPGDAGNESEV